MSASAVFQDQRSGGFRIAAAGLFFCLAFALFLTSGHFFPHRAAGDDVWIRVRVNGPGELRYVAVVDCETDPYKPARKAVGTLAANGLLTPEWLKPGGNDWPRPLAFVKPANLDGWLSPGVFTDWAKLPKSSKAQWHCAVLLRRPGKDQKFSADVSLQFATSPSESSIFKTAEEDTNDRATISFRMPTKPGPDGLRMVRTFREWAIDRRNRVKKELTGTPPKLEKLKVRTWVNFQAYRKQGGSLGKFVADLDFQNLRDLGINGVAAASLQDDLLGELSAKYGIRGSMLTSWATGVQGFIRRGKGKYDPQPGETFEGRLSRVFDDLYAKRASDVETKSPNLFKLLDHVVLGDEITGRTRSDNIVKNAELLEYFRAWLRGQGLAPSDLGYRSWDEVLPVDDREKLNTAPLSLTYAKNFYYTRRFINHYTSVFYRAATNAVEKHFPQADIIAVNYQAGPMQFGFIGSDNDLDKGQLDIFELGRERAFKGAMTEDWVKGWDLGIGRELFGAGVIRSSARKHDLPLADYVVGGEAMRSEMIAMASQGIKELNLYLYGPISNIGIAWADNPRAISQTADAVRLLSKFEDEIAAARPAKTKAAMLVSTAYDIMQSGGREYIPERQDLFVALAQSQIPVDIVSEGEILNDDILSKYKILYVVDPQVPDSVQQKISSWVGSGGWLWASAGALRFNEFGEPARDLDKVFGLSSRNTVIQEGGIKPSAPPWTAKVNRFGLSQIDELNISGGTYRDPVKIAVRGVKTSARPLTARVIGRYNDGSPGAFENDFGKGKAFLIGALVGNAYLNEHYPGEPGSNESLGEDWSFGLGQTTAAAAAGPAGLLGLRHIKTSVPGVYVSELESKDARLIFLINASGRPIPSIRIDAGRFSGSPLSARGSRIERDANGGFSLPLDNCDIVLLKK